ncbi:MAG: ribokinase [Candidatus Hydrogenedentales bacterium]
MKKILVAGSANMDLVVRTERLPKAGETLMGSDFMTAFGGKGANQAVAAARLGGAVHFVGCLGNDVFGKLHHAGLKEEHIQLEGLKIDHDTPTGTAMIMLTRSGENTIVVAPGANDQLTPEDIYAQRALFEDADAVISQLEIPLETVEAVLRLARDCEVLSILDTGPARPLPPEIIALPDIISPNETETETLTDIAVDDLARAEEAAEALRSMGAKEVVIKLGKLGCLYLGEERYHQPAFEIEAVDTTGAGDAFTAALALAWNTRSMPEALRFANGAGALAAMVAGAQPSMPRLDTLTQFLEKNNEPG